MEVPSSISSVAADARARATNGSGAASATKKPRTPPRASVARARAATRSGTSWKAMSAATVIGRSTGSPRTRAGARAGGTCDERTEPGRDQSGLLADHPVSAGDVLDGEVVDVRRRRLG